MLVLLGHVLSLLCFTNTRFSLFPPLLLFPAAYHHLLQAVASWPVGRSSLHSARRLALDPRRAGRPIAEHQHSILDSVLRLKLISTSSLSYLSLYVHRPPYRPPRDDAFLVPHHPALPYRDYRLSFRLPAHHLAWLRRDLESRTPLVRYQRSPSFLEIIPSLPAPLIQAHHPHHLHHHHLHHSFHIQPLYTTHTRSPNGSTPIPGLPATCPKHGQLHIITDLHGLLVRWLPSHKLPPQHTRHNRPRRRASSECCGQPWAGARTPLWNI